VPLWLKLKNFVSIFVILAIAQAARAQDETLEQKKKELVTPPRPTRGAARVSGDAAYPPLPGRARNHLRGGRRRIQIGGGYFSEKWFSMGSADILLGPYDRSREEKIKTDYNGSGFTVWSGYDFSRDGLRGKSGGYGLAVAAKYFELQGRSVSKSPPHEEADGSSTYIDNYVARIRSISVIPALYFAWIKKERPSGNAPELLVTRVEGFLLMLGVGYPIDANYSAKFKEYSEDASGSSETEKTMKQSGSMNGRTYVVSFTTLLGV